MFKNQNDFHRGCSIGLTQLEASIQIEKSKILRS